MYGSKRKFEISTLDHKSKIATLIATRCKVHSTIRSQLQCVKNHVDDVFARNFVAPKNHSHMAKYLQAFSLGGSRHALSVLSAAIRYGIVESSAPAHFWLMFGVCALEGTLVW